MAYSGKKRTYLGSGVGKSLFRCTLSLPQHAGDHGVSSVDDGLEVAPHMGICSALE